ncbi:YicC family protein [candidate division KSB1 bacterium]|nr:YicC family protein [candidate division KSB1 bacterium]
MITSMTGYGRAATRSDGIEVLVEVRSVNNRFLDVMAKMPRAIAGFEQQVRDSIAQKIQRGRVSVSISVAGSEDNTRNLQLNLDLVKAYLRMARKLRLDVGIKGKLGIKEVLQLPDVIAAPTPETANEALWQIAQQALQEAVDQLVAMRANEGKNLAVDFRRRIEQIEKLIAQIETLSADQALAAMEKFRERVKKLLGSSDSIDEGRLEMELALIADRIDVTEECVRFHSHNQVFLQTLDLKPSQGRKLNFLLQEMHREANTIGSKTSLSQVSHIVVSIKDEIEKMREQIQNIE